MSFLFCGGFHKKPLCKLIFLRKMPVCGTDIGTAAAVYAKLDFKPLKLRNISPVICPFKGHGHKLNGTGTDTASAAYAGCCLGLISRPERKYRIVYLDNGAVRIIK